MLLHDYGSLLYEAGLNPSLIDYYPTEENVRGGLSRRDVAFCYLISRGVPKEDAYCIAYSARNNAPQAMREATNRRLRLPQIEQEMTRLVNSEVQPSPTHDPMWLQRTVINDMLSIVRDPKAGPMARTKAGEIVLRHIGLTLTELAKSLPQAKAENSKGVIEDLERILAQNTGGPVTRATLTNGKDDLTLE